jgi:DhnA family fructose-bisphosphate aldolase class Ia
MTLKVLLGLQSCRKTGVLAQGGKTDWGNLEEEVKGNGSRAAGIAIGRNVWQDENQMIYRKVSGDCV